MALKKCRECGKEVSTKAAKCPNCGAPVKKASSLINSLVTILFVVLFIVGIGTCFESDSTPPTKNKAKRTSKPVKTPEEIERDRIYNDKLEVRVVCEKFVKARLKSPSTAKFPYVGPDEVLILDDGCYGIASYVNGQNSFGATIRTHFRCIVEKNDTGGWDLVSLKFE